jgi:hypothetical protein
MLLKFCSAGKNVHIVEFKLKSFKGAYNFLF